MSGAPTGSSAPFAPYNLEPDQRPPRGERIRERYGGGYVPFVQRRRGPAPMASVEDISVRSFEISPAEEEEPQQQRYQQQQQQQQEQEQQHSWRRGEEDGSRFQYSSYATTASEYVCGRGGGGGGGRKVDKLPDSLTSPEESKWQLAWPSPAFFFLLLKHNQRRESKGRERSRPFL